MPVKLTLALLHLSDTQVRELLRFLPAEAHLSLALALDSLQAFTLQSIPLLFRGTDTTTLWQDCFDLFFLIDGNLHDHSSLASLRQLYFLFAAVAQIAAKREGRLLVVCIGRRVRDAQRTVLSTAVSQLNLFLWRGHILVMASLAHVVSSVAEVDGYTAAEEALPVNVLGAMLFADGLSSAVFL